MGVSILWLQGSHDLLTIGIEHGLAVAIYLRDWRIVRRHSAVLGIARLTVLYVIGVLLRCNLSALIARVVKSLLVVTDVRHSTRTQSITVSIGRFSINVLQASILHQPPLAPTR